MGTKMGAALLLFAISAQADWPRFRGANGSGLSTNSTLPAAITAEHEQWVLELPGIGHGSPVVFGDRLFLLSAVPVSRAAAVGKKAKKSRKAPSPHRWVTLCIDRHKGTILWQKNFPARAFKGHRFNTAASSTAAVDATRVVFAWGTAESLSVVALSHAGELIWERDLGPVVGGHGFGGSPILHEDLVVLNNDQEGAGNLLALNAATGADKWTVPRRCLRLSYSVPCLYKDLLVFTNWQHGFTAVSPKDGTVVADKSVFFLGTNERAISSPIVAGGMVIGTCGFTANPKHCVAMKLNGDTWEEIWRIEDHVAHIPCLLAIDQHLYMIEDNGIASCVEIGSGKVTWKARIPDVQGKIFGSPVSDGKNLFFADEGGNLHSFAANSEEFASQGHLALDEICRSTPAIIGNTLYVRSVSRLRAYSAK
jgi:outer membrane protein assembly factor BamB